MEKRWRERSEEVLNGRKEWHQAHPTATFREREDAVQERMRRLETHMRQETAWSSKQTDWAQEPKEQRPLCPNGGTA